MTHPNQSRMMQYLADALNDHEMLQISSHLMECPECLTQSRFYSFLKQNFEFLFENWTAVQHGKINHSLAFVETLEHLDAAIPVTGFRLSHLPEMVMTVFIDHSRRLASAAARAFTDSLAFQPAAVQSGIGSPDAVITLQKHLEHSRDALIAQNSETAHAELKAASTIDGFTVQSDQLNIFLRNQLQSTVIADSRKQRISVLFRPDASGTIPVWIILAPADKNFSPRTAAFHPVTGADYVLAEFNAIPDGMFTLFQGPLQSPDTHQESH